METVTLGIDVACRAAHRAALADHRGRILWSRSFRTAAADLEGLWAKLPEGASVTVVLEPTRNAWAPLAAWFRARGAKVVLVPPEQAADLRDYFAKHTKTDRLDARMLARVPLLHPEGLREADHLGAASALRRAVKRRAVLSKRLRATLNRIACLLELYGPALAEAPGGADYGRTALAFLTHYGDPRKARRLGRGRLAEFLRRHSQGAWREEKADELLSAVREAEDLWACGELDFSELAADLASEARLAQALREEIAQAEGRIASLYAQADPKAIFRAPGWGRSWPPGCGDAWETPTASGAWRGCALIRGWSAVPTSPGTPRGTPGPPRPGTPPFGRPSSWRLIKLAGSIPSWRPLTTG